MKLRIIQVLAPVLTISIIIKIIILVKFRFFPEWTFYSFFTSYQSIGLLTGLILPTVFIFIKAYRSTDSETFIISIIRNSLGTLEKAGKAILILLTSFISLALLIFFWGESAYLEGVNYYLKNHNWIYAEKEIEALDQAKIRPQILNTFKYYILTHKESDTHNYPEGETLRQRKNAIEKLLFEDKFDYQLMNTLSIAEINKSLYFTEDEPDHITSGLSVLDKPKENAGIILKRGELLLAIKDYSKAKEEFNLALKKSPNSTQNAIILCNLGNIFAAEGDYKKAIDNYQKSERNYPDIRKFIFYSNYSYILMLNQDYDNAEKKVKLALKINPDDWYSYLNLGLIQEKKKNYHDAIHNFNLVIDKTDNKDSRREAGILKGRCMEISGYEEKECLTTYLKALGKDFSNNAVQYHLTHKNILYNDLITGLKETNTHGIEHYIEWFRTRIK